MTEPKTLTLEIPVRWGDMDAYGHINNVAIVRLLEEARIAAFGAPPSAGNPTAKSPQALIPLFTEFEDGVQALIAEHQIRYRQQLPYRALPIRAEVSVAKVTPASITLNYELFDSENFDSETPKSCVSAQTTLAFYNVKTGGIQRLSKQQRERLATFIRPTS